MFAFIFFLALPKISQKIMHKFVNKRLDKSRILIKHSLRHDRTSALYNLGSGSSLAIGAAAKTAAIQLHTLNVQLDPRYAASKHTTAPINHTRPSPRKHSPDVTTHVRKQISDYSLLLNLSTSKG